MSKVFGFVAEPHKNGKYLVSPAYREGGEVTCCDLSGFSGSWRMKCGGEFFPTVSGDVLCQEAMNMAVDHATTKNKVMSDRLEEIIQWAEARASMNM